MRSCKVFFIRVLAFALMLLLAQSVLSQSNDPAKATKSDVNVSFKDVRPSKNFRQFDGMGFSLGYPDNWNTATGKDSTIIGPPEAMGDAGIAYGMIVGTNLSSEAASLDDAIRHLSQGLVQQNSGMRVSGEPQHITVNGVEGRSLDLLGNSPIQKNGRPLPEHDWLVVLPRGQGGLLYLVFISPERDFSQLHATYQKMVDSVQLH
jgi:hypothetical protein